MDRLFLTKCALTPWNPLLLEVVEAKIVNESQKGIQQITEGRIQLWLSITMVQAEPPGQKVSYPAACQRLGHYPQQRWALCVPLFPYISAPGPRWKLGLVLEVGLDGAPGWWVTNLAPPSSTDASGSRSFCNAGFLLVPSHIPTNDR